METGASLLLHRLAMFKSRCFQILCECQVHRSYFKVFLANFLPVQAMDEHFVML